MFTTWREGWSGELIRRGLSRAFAAALLLIGVMAGSAAAAATLPVLWTAGGLSAGADSAGQAARMAVDASGNVAVVSGPGFYSSFVVTSYTSSGALRWQRTVAPLSGNMAANWVAAAPNGDVVVLGSTFNTQATYAITLVRYASDGTLLWRLDPPDVIYRSSVGRLAVDSAGSAYVTFNNEVVKYSALGILLWRQTIPAGFTTSLALGPDGSDVVVTGNFWGSANSVVASFNAATGASRWVVSAAEGSNDVTVGDGRVYVTGQGYTGAGTPAIAYFLTVVAYDRATGARQWRTDSSPGSTAITIGQRIALAPDGSLVAVGYATSGTGYLDWWIVAMEANGAVRWQARRDGATYPDEIPAVVFVLGDGTTVVSGLGGPLVGPTPTGMSYPQGVTAGYSPSGTLLWEGFSTLPTVWAAALPSGDVCATGGYDALITCFQVPGSANYQPVLTASPLSGAAPLIANFTRSVATDPNGPIISYVTLDYGDSAPGISGTLDFGDGSQTFTLNKISSHTYTTAGTYVATLTVFYSNAVTASNSVTINVNPAVVSPVFLRSTAINLSATRQKNRVNVIGNVTVKNSIGAAISGAVVTTTWARPGGGAVTQTATTNANGVARFSTSGGRGTYTLTVTGISKTGYSFDSANSVLSRSITR